MMFWVSSHELLSVVCSRQSWVWVVGRRFSGLRSGLRSGLCGGLSETFDLDFSSFSSIFTRCCFCSEVDGEHFTHKDVHLLDTEARDSQFSYWYRGWFLFSYYTMPRCHLVALWLEQAARVQRLPSSCGGRRFDSRPLTLRCVSSPSLCPVSCFILSIKGHWSQKQRKQYILGVS